MGRQVISESLRNESTPHEKFGQVTGTLPPEAPEIFRSRLLRSSFDIDYGLT